jgi:hypothetical protein
MSVIHVHLHRTNDKRRKAKDDDDPKAPHAFVGPMSAQFCARCGMPRSNPIHVERRPYSPWDTKKH